MTKRRRYIPSLIYYIPLIACACTLTTTDKPQAVTDESQATKSSATAPPQTDSNGIQLPFHNPFFERWNDGNDGTTYEPCTALTPNELKSAGIDPKSAKDAAVVDGQSLRGCDWLLLPPNPTLIGISQIVINSQNLETYKKKNSIDTWRPDREIHGRQVGIVDSRAGDCSTYVQSRKSAIITLGQPGIGDSDSKDELCESALRFTATTIDRIPR